MQTNLNRPQNTENQKTLINQKKIQSNYSSGIPFQIAIAITDNETSIENNVAKDQQINKNHKFVSKIDIVVQTVKMITTETITLDRLKTTSNNLYRN